MTKLVALVASLCFLSIIGVAYCRIEVQGSIYCDNCRVLFETRISTPATNAEIVLECTDRENSKNVTLSQTTKVVNEQGQYKFEVEGDHEDEICQVRLVKNFDESCTEIIPGLDRARVLISDKNGISSTVRFVNPLGFVKATPLPECAGILRSYDLLPSAHI